MKNADFILRNMMELSIDVAKPRVNITRAREQMDYSMQTLQGAFLVKEAHKASKTKVMNEIFDRDTLVPDVLKAKPPVLASVKNLSEAGKTLAKQSKVVAAKKAA